MPANIKNGDLLTAESGIIIHGCNSRGVMGSGVARQIRDKWPVVYKAYRYSFETSGLELGDIQTVPVFNADKSLLVVNAITQKDYGRDAGKVYVDYNAITEAFTKTLLIAKQLSDYNSAMMPIHYPKIGGGLANGDFNIIYASISEVLGNWDHTLWLPEGEEFKPA